MSGFSTIIKPEHRKLIEAQPVFFVATSAADGRINLSPKGYDAFRVLNDDRVAYLDLSGSGNETQAHLVADGRITIMFCNFTGPPRILRLYGTGVPVLPQDDGWNELASHFTLLPGTRQIFDIQVESVQTSCGFGVPLMHLEKERETLIKHHAQTNRDDWLAKQAGRTESIDGLTVRPTTRFIES